MQLVESVRDLGRYGPAKPAAEQGLDEASSVYQVSNYLLSDVRP